MRTTFRLPLLAGALACLAGLAFAATTQVVRDDNFDTLQNGELEGAALSSDGFIYPSYEREQVGDTGAEIVWTALAQKSKPGILCATGHHGKLVRLEGKEKKDLASFPEPELTAMTEMDDGTVLVAASPSGRIYQLGLDDKVTTLTQLDAKFVWDMKADESGQIWVATGDEGRLYKISRLGAETKVELVHEFQSKNLLDLWIDREGKMGEKGAIYVAGQNPGWLHRFLPASGASSIAFNSESDEIRALCPTDDGLAMATNTDRAPTPQALNLTLRMGGGAVSGGGSGGEGGEGGGPPRGPQGSKPTGDVFSPSGKKPAGGPASVVTLLTRDGFARPLWVSPERPIHSIAPAPGGTLLAAAGGKGRLFEIQSRGIFALVADTQDEYLVKIVPVSDGYLLAAARNGVVHKMGRERAKTAVYRSRILDAGGPVRWGRFYWMGQMAAGQSISASFRKGNSDDPDKEKWADWSAEADLKPDQGAKVPEGAARYLQYRLTLNQGSGTAEPLRSDYIEAFYQGLNRAPILKSVAVSDGAARRPSGGSSGGGSEGGSEGGSSSGSSTRASGGSAPPSEAAPQGGGRKPDSNAKNLILAWSAEDPNGDSLIFAVYYRASDEAEWKLIEDKLKTSRLPLGINAVADGRYRFKVVASDELDNPPGQGLQAELVSDEIVIDNTPPEIQDLKVEPEGDRARVRFRAVDALSFISSITVDLDGGDAYPIFPEDGLFDQTTETVDWKTQPLKKGEHVLTINATDRRGNSTARKAVFKTGQ